MRRVFVAKSMSTKLILQIKWSDGAAHVPAIVKSILLRVEAASLFSPPIFTLLCPQNEMYMIVETKSCFNAASSATPTYTSKVNPYFYHRLNEHAVTGAGGCAGWSRERGTVPARGQTPRDRPLALPRPQGRQEVDAEQLQGHGGAQPVQLHGGGGRGGGVRRREECLEHRLLRQRSRGIVVQFLHAHAGFRTLALTHAVIVWCHLLPSPTNSQVPPHPPQCCAWFNLVHHFVAAMN